jgi:hypothetical protein
MIKKTTLAYLDLCSPLFYKKTDKLFSKLLENEEFIVLYELDPIQSRSIEPVRELFPGKLIFTAQKFGDLCLLPDAKKVVLPAGKYLFSQYRNKFSVIKQNELFDLAIDQQKDGLWERNKLANQLYVRYLFEDSLFVTQLFRPRLLR